MKELFYFTDGRVPQTNLRKLFSLEHRWQQWLTVEAALAEAEADLGIIPRVAAKVIAQKASLKYVDAGRVRERIAATSHPLTALVFELSDVVGEPYGGWVHWGATTQNITQTGDALVLREAHDEILNLLSRMLTVLAPLAERTADTVTAGRTHGQQAVPITFGLRVAVWIDELLRHIDRLQAVEERVFTAMLGGAVGNFASLGKQGPAVQLGVAQRLGLVSMEVPARSISDSLAEYVCILGLLAGTGGKIATEIYTLMATEFGEVREPAPKGTIGSSTMPHKYNPQLSDDCLTIAAEIRALVPLALEGMVHEHEVRSANSAMTDEAIQRSCILTGDMLSRLLVIFSGLELDEQRMLTNLKLTGGFMSSEAIMLQLGEIIGRQRAHEVVYEDAQKSAKEGIPFAAVLFADPRVTDHVSLPVLEGLLDPVGRTGLSSDIARKSAIRARAAVAQFSKQADKVTPASHDNAKAPMVRLVL
jgi:3-carboxy-cis,cis-muconate cycloisomerase